MPSSLSSLCGGKGKDVVKRMGIVEEIRNHYGPLRSDYRIPATSKLAKSDSLQNMHINDYAFWTLDKMMKCPKNQIILDMGSGILMDLNRAQVWVQSNAVKKVSDPLSKWALTYDGPHWDIVHVYLAEIYEHYEKDKLAPLIEASIRNLSKMAKTDPKTPAHNHIWRMLAFTTCTKSSLHSKWDSDAGVTAVSWGLSYYQNNPRFEPIHRILSICESLCKSKVIKFPARYWTAKEFTAAVNSFLPTIVTKFQDGDEPKMEEGGSALSIKDISFFSVKFYSVWMIFMTNYDEFLKAMRDNNFPESAKKAMDTLANEAAWKTDPKFPGGNLILLIFAVVFSILSKVNDKKFSVTTLKLLEKYLDKVDPKTQGVIFDALNVKDLLDSGILDKLRSFVAQGKVLKKEEPIFTKATALAQAMIEKVEEIEKKPISAICTACGGEVED